MATKKTEQITTKTVLNRVRDEKMPFDWSINPYRGCAHGCSFCYARAFQGYLGLGADDEFQNHILLKVNAAEALEHQLSRLSRKYGGDLDAVGKQVGLVAIGTATDPYQPVESKEFITRKCLNVLAKYRIPVTITTRSPLILRDLSLLSEMNVASVNISLNTLRPDLTRTLEPAAPLPARRLETVETLARNGIKAGLFIAPILPYLTDSEEHLDALLHEAREHQASFAMTSLLRLTPDVKKWFYRTLYEYSPELVNKYIKLYPSTYALRAYSEPLMERVRAMLSRHNLSNELPQPEAAASCPASQLFASRDAAAGEQQPMIEQLSFSF